MKTFTVTEKPGVGFRVNKADAMSLFSIPMGQGIEKALEGAPEGATVLLTNLDLAGEGEEMRFTREIDRGDVTALVAVETAAGVGGTTALFSNVVEERLKGRRVERVARPIEYALGVKVIRTVTTDEGTSYLVSMAPGASFKIMRTGSLEGGDPELVVLWNGRYDGGRYWREHANLPRHLSPAQIKAQEAALVSKYLGLSVRGRNVRHARF